MTPDGSIKGSTKVSLTLTDLVKQAALLISIVGSGVLWTTSKLSEQREANVKQDERIAAVEMASKRHEADNAALNVTLTRFADKIEVMQAKLSEISTGVARIDERTRKP